MKVCVYVSGLARERERDSQSRREKYGRRMREKVK